MAGRSASYSSNLFGAGKLAKLAGMVLEESL